MMPCRAPPQETPVLVVGEVVELELELIPDCELEELPLEDEDEDDPVGWLLDVFDALDVFVVVPLLVVVVALVVVTRWLPAATPKALNPSIAATAMLRFRRDTMRRASAFERLGAAEAVCRFGAASGAAGRMGGTAGVSYALLLCSGGCVPSRGGYAVVG